MTTNGFGLAVSLVALASLLPVSACGSDSKTSSSVTSAHPVANVAFAASPESGLPTAYPAPRSDSLTIGLLNPDRATEALTTMYDAAKDEVKQLGGTTIELDAALDPDKQVTEFQQLINQKVDAIGIVPIADPKLLGPLMAQAAKANIPVIGLEVSPAKPGPVPGFASQILQGRDHLVYLQVKAAAEGLGKGAKVGLLGIALPIPLFEFTAVRQRYWAQKFGLKIVGEAKSANDTTEGGQKAATGLITQHPDMVGIIGYNDEPAIGAALAARSAGRNDIKTFGVGAGSLGRNAIKSKRLTASVFLDTAAEGRLLARGLLDAAQGTDVPPAVLTDAVPYVVTRDNVDKR